MLSGEDRRSGLGEDDDLEKIISKTTGKNINKTTKQTIDKPTKKTINKIG